MSDLFLGQTCTEFLQFICNGSSDYTFQFSFQPDKVVFTNLTEWTATAGGRPINVWYRNQTTAGHSYTEQVIDSSAGASFNFANIASNGFTVADLPGGQATSHATISAITQADPGVVTHSAYTFQENQIVRLTDLGQVTPTLNRGMGALNNNRYRLHVLSATTFSLKDVITGEPIDTTTMTAYVSGGLICLETHVISLNNPQVYPYSDVAPYNPNPYKYDPVTYRLTVGTAILGGNNEICNIEVYKFGNVIDMGKLV